MLSKWLGIFWKNCKVVICNFNPKVLSILGETRLPGGGGGGTDSLSLSTNCETTAPLFGQRTAPVLLPPNLQPPLFMDNQAQPLEIRVKWCIFCIHISFFYQIIVLKGFKNKFECIQLLFDVEYWMQIL